MTTQLAFEHCNCTALRRASRIVSHFYDRELAPSGLRVTQFVILRYLTSSPGMSVNELASLLDLDRTTTGKNLQPMVNAGFVTVTKSPSDKRASLIKVTAAGSQVFETASPLWRKAQTEFEAVNGTEVSSKLRATLNTIKVHHR